jgi:hypothetical protein
MTSGRIARELWWTNQGYSLSISFHHASSSWEMSNRFIGGCSLQTLSYLININDSISEKILHSPLLLEKVT